MTSTSRSESRSSDRRFPEFRSGRRLPSLVTAPVYRTTIRASWRWMRLDLLARLLPLALAPLLVAWLTHTPLDAFGLTLAHPLRDLVVAAPLGLLGFAIAAAFAEYLARRSKRWFVPDVGDLAVQTTYYIVLN